MSLLNIISEVGGASAVTRLGARVGLDRNQTESALAALLPALSGGIKRRALDSGGALSGFLEAARDDPEDAAARADPAEGNAILGQIFGSKDVSRNVAAHAAQETGIGVDKLKALLPLVASVAASSLRAKSGQLGQGWQAQMGAESQPRGPGQMLQSGGWQGLLAMLDEDKDGNPLDDIIGLAGRLFGR
ncbi:MAG TPA: DUF937 domain-containing protein [Sphingomonadales bacterium]